jgi:hypothetical protein
MSTETEVTTSASTTSTVKASTTMQTSSTLNVVTFRVTSTTRPRTTTTIKATTTTRVCHKPYIGNAGGCCIDLDGNGVCDSLDTTTITTTSTTLDPFERLFTKIANKTPEIVIVNGTSVNLGDNEFVTIEIIENITGPYRNNYCIKEYRGKLGWVIKGNGSYCKYTKPPMWNETYGLQPT